MATASRLHGNWSRRGRPVPALPVVPPLGSRGWKREKQRAFLRSQRPLPRPQGREPRLPATRGSARPVPGSGTQTDIVTARAGRRRGSERPLLAGVLNPVFCRRHPEPTEPGAACGACPRPAPHRTLHPSRPGNLSVSPSSLPARPGSSKVPPVGALPHRLSGPSHPHCSACRLPPAAGHRPDFPETFREA